MSNNRKRNKKLYKEIAIDRINQLFTLAEKYARLKRINLSDRYVEIARRISMKTLVPIPKQYKRRFCKHCYSYFHPNETYRVRIKKGKIVIYCFKCKKYSRIPLKKNKQNSSVILK